MATRVYFPEATAAPVTVTPPAGWTHDSGVRRQLAIGTPGSSTLTTQAYAPDADVHIGTPGASLFRQYVSAPLATQTISGTVIGQLQCFEDSAANNLGLSIAVYTVTNAGSSVTHTLLATVTQQLTEVNTALRNQTLSSLTLTGTTITAGQRLVIELGLGGTPSASGGTQGHNGSIRWGETASSGDLPIDSTTTATTYRPWLEFSSTISLQVISASDGTAAGLAATVQGAGATILPSLGASTTNAATVTAVGEAVVVAASFAGESQWAQRQFLSQHWQPTHWGGTNPVLHSGNESQWTQRHFRGQHWQDTHWGGTDPAPFFTTTILLADGTAAGAASVTAQPRITATATGVGAGVAGGAAVTGRVLAAGASTVGLGTAVTVSASIIVSAGSSTGAALAPAGSAWKLLTVGSSTGVAAAHGDGDSVLGPPVLNSHWAAPHWTAGQFVETALNAVAADGVAAGTAAGTAVSSARAQTEGTAPGSAGILAVTGTRRAVVGTISGVATVTALATPLSTRRRSDLGLTAVATQAPGSFHRVISGYNYTDGTARGLAAGQAVSGASARVVATAAGMGRVTGLSTVPGPRRRTRLAVTGVAGRPAGSFQRGIQILEATGTAVGVASALGRATTTALAIGTSVGLATVTGQPVLLGVNPADGHAAGLASVVAISGVRAGVVATAPSGATVTGAAAPLIVAAGASTAGLATVLGSTAIGLQTTGAITGQAGGVAASVTLLATIGSSQGTTGGGAASLDLGAMLGSAVGRATVLAVAASYASAVGHAAGSATVQAGVPAAAAEHPPTAPRLPVHTATLRRQSVTLRSEHRLPVSNTVSGTTVLDDD